MRLENCSHCVRVASRAIAAVLPLLALALANCSSSDPPNSGTTAGSAGVSASAGNASGGTSPGVAGQTSGGSSAGTATGGAAGASSAGSATGGSSAGSSGSATSGAGAGGTAVGGSGPAACVTVADFATWPAGKSPTEIGKLAVENFKSHTGDPYGGAGYAWTFAYVGSLQFTKLVGDSASNTKLIADFERYATGSTEAPNNDPPPSPPGATVDDRAFGDLPLEIFIENQDERSKELGLDRADVQWSVTFDDGITRDARYWADDMFMITGLQVYAYRATQDVKYRDRAAKAMIAYLGALQQPDGHFWHTKQSKAYWGRANGWIAAGMTELLLELPAGAERDAIMAGYKKQMDALVGVQVASGADAGTWRQVLDLPSAQPESSCTAMFTFALVTGVRNGWLSDPKYATAAKNGWTALGNKTNSSGVLDKVCPGTGQADTGTIAQQQAFYTGIALGSNDQHGQAPLLWAARALLRPDCPGVR
jgi:unsaturated rhamnogalacturonyl hydrolase